MIKAVNQIVRNTPRGQFATGIHASFKKITDEWGLKFFDYKGRRDTNYARQKEAAECGCGPRIGRKFTTTDINGDKVYGYVTECVVKTYSRKRNGYYLHQYQIEEDYDVKMLFEKMIENNISINDMHAGNMGYLADGRLVAIDFSV